MRWHLVVDTKQQSLFGAAVLCLLLVPACSGYGEDKAAACAPGVPPRPPHAITGETCPVLGRMGEMKLAIPKHYLLGPVEYKGQSIWSPEDWKKRPKKSTFETELSSFAIKIRQTDFRPIENQKDWDDYKKLGHSVNPQPPENRWLEVDFEHIGNVRTLKPVALDFGDALNNWLSPPYSWGYFVRQPQRQWGLDHYVSDRQPSSGPNGWQYEIFYDASSHKTFITCKSALKTRPPHELTVSCRHQFDFYSTDSGEVIHISNEHIYTKNDIAHWREFEQGIRSIFSTFIVR